MANLEHLAQLKQGIKSWNQWRKKHPQIKVDLAAADLFNADLPAIDFNSVDLFGANLIGANLTGSNLDRANLFHANFVGADLRNTKLRGADLREANLNYANLAGANLQEADLRGADLREANLNGAKLLSANLFDANLSKVQLLKANLTAVVLTSACIEDWHINGETKLERIDCDYIYLQLKWNALQEKYEYTERCPSNENEYFAIGEFSHLFQQSVRTINLTFANGIDWMALVIALQKYNLDNGSEELSIEAIEHKYGGNLAITVHIPPASNKTKIENFLQQEYESACQALAENYRSQFQAEDEQIAIYRQQNANLTEMIKLLATRPLNSNYLPDDCANK